jgi:hypothetical protein
MLASLQTLREINEANSRFWRKQRSLFDERMANDAIRETASEAWQAQQHRAVPLACQFSLEKALEDAERAGQRFLAQLARRGGTASKTDSLQLLIQKTVSRCPDISADRLLDALRANQGIDPAEDIDEHTIHFTNHDGRSKKASVSGLKDRLSRAKKKLESR